MLIRMIYTLVNIIYKCKIMTKTGELTQLKALITLNHTKAICSVKNLSQAIVKDSNLRTSSNPVLSEPTRPRIMSEK